MKSMKNAMAMVLIISLMALIVGGCNNKVPQGTRGRVKTSDGWQDKTLDPGHQTCYGRDTMYLIDDTQNTYMETMNILVGGKVNLTLTVQIRCALSQNEKLRLLAFEKVMAKNVDHKSHAFISNQDMYNTYLKLKVQSIPREIIGSKSDVQTVVANRTEIANVVRQRIIKESKSTILEVFAVEITNYDWPDSITNAQEELVKVQLAEKTVEAQVRADLRKAEGDLKVAEATKLVEIKKAEALAESIKVIKGELAGSPEYLQWHTVRALKEAAKGPNNAFILFPYNMPGMDTNSMVGNAQLKQMIKTKN